MFPSSNLGRGTSYLVYTYIFSFVKMRYALCLEGDVYHNVILTLGERTGQACQDCLENRSVGDELAWGQDLHSPQNLHKEFLFC